MEKLHLAFSVDSVVYSDSIKTILSIGTTNQNVSRWAIKHSDRQTV